jgi:chromosome segregation ATPase
MEPEPNNLRARGEEAIAELAQALIDNPLFGSAVKGALGASERAAQAQRSAMGALNFASAADVERVEQRLRSLSSRLEEVEDRLDELGDEVARLRRQRGSEPG